MNEAEWTAVEEALAAGDPDRHVSVFFAPARLRRALTALYAFDHEVSRIGAVVREPMAGHIRLAWWREQIGAAFAGAEVEAPVPRALAATVRAHRLPHELFETYLAARGAELEEAPFDDEAALERHAAESAGVIMRLAARVLGAEGRADEAARLAGIAHAVSGHVRDLAYFAARRRCRLPAAWLAEAGLNAEDVFETREAATTLGPVLARLKGKVREALGELNAARFPRAATAALATATLSRWAARRAFDPFRPQALPNWQRVARLSAANLTWRF